MAWWGDDLVIVNVECHGSGYIDYQADSPRNVAYHGFTFVQPTLNQTGNPDEFDCLESDYEMSVFCGGGVLGGTPPYYDFHRGLGQWLTSWHPTSKFIRWKYLSHYDNVSVAGFESPLSDDDQDIDYFTDYTLGDTNHNGTIEPALGEVLDWDGDGIPPYDRATGIFDEDDWGPIDTLRTTTGRPIHRFQDTPTASSTPTWMITSTSTSLRIQRPSEVDGTDLDNDGIIEGIDLNDDGDMTDSTRERDHHLRDNSLVDDQLAAVFNGVGGGAKVFISTPASAAASSKISAAPTHHHDRQPRNHGSPRACSPMLNEAFSTYKSEADADGNGRISMLEAFNYAERHPIWAPAGMDLFQYDDNGDRLPASTPSPRTPTEPSAPPSISPAACCEQPWTAER